MSDAIELAVAIIVVALGYLMVKFANKFGDPQAMVNEYVCFFKVGRIKQFAKEKNMDIDEVMAYEEARKTKNIRESWNERIESGLAQNLSSVDYLQDKAKPKKAAVQKKVKK